jgi:Flp pilus assembly protein TadD
MPKKPPSKPSHANRLTATQGCVGRAKRAILLGMLTAVCMLAGCHQLTPSGLNLDPDTLASDNDRQTKSASSQMDKASAEPRKELAAIAKMEQKGRGPEAVYAYEKLIAEGKATATVYQRLAILLDRQGKFDQSAKYFLAALKADPENAEILCDYGYSRFVQGDLATAEKSLRRAVELAPDLARANNNLALVLARLEHEDEALKHFKLAGATASQASRNLQYALASHPTRREDNPVKARADSE